MYYYDMLQASKERNEVIDILLPCSVDFSIVLTCCVFYQSERKRVLLLPKPREKEKETF